MHGSWAAGSEGVQRSFHGQAARNRRERPQLVDKPMVLSWLMLYCMVNEVHVWGGFPCVHLSSAEKP